MVVKNYPSMCELLGEKVKSGKSKVLQLKRWEKFIEFEQYGHKYKILSIRDTPKPKELRANDIYSKDILTVLTDYIIKKETNSLKTNCSNPKDFILLCGFMNDEYKNIKTIASNYTNEEYYSKKYNFFLFNKLYVHIKSDSKKIFMNCLNRLEKRNIINVNVLYDITFLNGKTRQASNEEAEMYEKLMRKIKNDLNISVLSLYNDDNFKKVLSDELHKKGIDKIYKRTVINRGIENDVYVINETEVENAKIRINNNFLNRMYNHITNDIDKQTKKLIEKNINKYIVDDDLELLCEAFGKTTYEFLYEIEKENININKNDKLYYFKKEITDLIVKCDFS